MADKQSLPKDVHVRLTGMPRPSTFQRACYVVRVHGDGTGTIALDCYEMSDGRDYMGSEVFMRTEIGTALQVVDLLNSQLTFRVNAPQAIEWPDED